MAVSKAEGRPDRLIILGSIGPDIISGVAVRYRSGDRLTGKEGCSTGGDVNFPIKIHRILRIEIHLEIIHAHPKVLHFQHPSNRDRSPRASRGGGQVTGPTPVTELGGSESKPILPNHQSWNRLSGIGVDVCINTSLQPNARESDLSCCDPHQLLIISTAFLVLAGIIFDLNPLRPHIDRIGHIDFQ